MKPSKLFWFKDTKNSLGYFSKWHAIKNSSGQKKCDRDCVRWKWSTRWLVEDGMNTALTNTHTAPGISDLHQVLARKQRILCFALRHGCLTLLYVTSIQRFFLPPGTIMHGPIRLLPRSIESLWGCSLAINRMISIDPSSLKRKSLE